MTYRMRVREGVSIARQDRGMLTGGPAPWPSLTVSPARGPGPSLPGRRSWTPALRCLVSTQGSRAPPPGQTLTGLPPLSSAAQRACLRCPIMSVGRPLCSVYDARNACGPGLGREHGGGMSAEAPTPITRPAKLGEIAADRLRERILRGHLAPGSPLSQEMLAREFGISRTPMRDALKLLERDGLIQLDSSGLATVADPKDDDARDLLRIREVIDSVAAQRAAMLAEPLRRELALILQPIVDEMSDAAALRPERARPLPGIRPYHCAVDVRRATPLTGSSCRVIAAARRDKRRDRIRRCGTQRPAGRRACPARLQVLLRDRAADSAQPHARGARS